MSLVQALRTLCSSDSHSLSFQALLSQSRGTQEVTEFHSKVDLSLPEPLCLGLKPDSRLKAEQRKL